MSRSCSEAFGVEKGARTQEWFTSCHAESLRTKSDRLNDEESWFALWIGLSKADFLMSLLFRVDPFQASRSYSEDLYRQKGLHHRRRLPAVLLRGEEARPSMTSEDGRT